MALPDHLTLWAIDDQDPEGNDLKEIPAIEFQQTGLLKGQPFPRVWMNELFNNITEWIDHWRNEPVGTSILIRNAEAGGYSPVTERGWVTFSTDNTTITGFTIFTRNS